MRVVGIEIIAKDKRVEEIKRRNSITNTKEACLYMRSINITV